MAKHGYPDWQPPGYVVAAGGESPQLEALPLAERTGKHVGSTLEVGLYASLRLRVGQDALGGFVVALVEWFNNPLLTAPAGKRTITVAAKGEGPTGDLNAHIANLGPYCRITLSAGAGEAAKWTSLLEVYADNRTQPLEAPVEGPLVTDGALHTLKGPGWVYVYPKFYFAGGCVFGLHGAGTTKNSPNLYAWEPAAKEWEQVWAEEAVSKHGWRLFTIVVPLGAWKMGVTTAEAGEDKEVQVLIAPSSTGTV